MFSGEKVLVDLRCDNSLMKTMVDRFGEDVTALAYDMTSFRVQTEVSASPTFFGWVFGFNGKVQILAPESVKEQYRQMIAQADEGMQGKKQRTGNLTLQSILCQETAESSRKARSMNMPRAWSLKFIRLRIQPSQTIVVKFG